MHTLELRYSASLSRGKRLDFFISGKPLLREIEKRGFDLIPRIWANAFPLDSETRDLLMLQRNGDTPSGRVALYICPECGDYGCGVVSANIRHDGEFIVWSEFVWEVDYDETQKVNLEKLGPFKFNVESYRLALTVAGAGTSF